MQFYNERIYFNFYIKCFYFTYTLNTPVKTKVLLQHPLKYHSNT